MVPGNLMYEKICPIHLHGDYSTPVDKQIHYFPNIPRSWFKEHQPLGDRDETTLRHLVAGSTFGHNILEFFLDHSENQPYFLNYIRFDHNDYSTGNDFDRKKLEYFKLLPLEAEAREHDISVMVTEKKTVRFRPVHPIFIPMCLTWINVGPIDNRKCDLHVLGTTDRNWEENFKDDVAVTNL